MMIRPAVLIESPYAGNPEALRYLACCLLDSILRGEAPYAIHPATSVRPRAAET